MSETLRAFVAVELSEEARRAVARVTEALRRVTSAAARWVPPHNLHLTLKFLGQVSEELLDPLVRALAPRVAGQSPFDVEIGEVGAFPSARSARVLWVGVAGGAAQLARLARGVEGAAASVGLPRDHRPYRGHMTVARLREPARVPIERVERPSPVAIHVREIVLFRSDLGRGGARYQALARLPLGEGRGAEVEFVHPEG